MNIHIERLHKDAWQIIIDEIDNVREVSEQVNIALQPWADSHPATLVIPAPAQPARVRGSPEILSERTIRVSPLDAFNALYHFTLIRRRLGGKWTGMLHDLVEEASAKPK